MMSEKVYEGEPGDDISRLFWAAMRDKDLLDKLVGLGFIEVKPDTEGDDFSASWVGRGPALS